MHNAQLINELKSLLIELQEDEEQLIAQAKQHKGKDDYRHGYFCGGEVFTTKVRVQLEEKLRKHGIQFPECNTINQ
ncbi:hypothetical protein [Photobacterium sp. GB-72]|uniref:hypothetical protein n=1 Tax=Photobacterium sp. GB-72 TaxID=2022105 RepID=UPI000D17119A|nr:hypothetical protein [Photobacterium sp. GB-72]PSV26265.1 hypothetical protein C9J40_21525 [Photobacterium sp. GB-72]